MPTAGAGGAPLRQSDDDVALRQIGVTHQVAIAFAGRAAPPWGVGRIVPGFPHLDRVGAILRTAAGS